VTIVVGSSGPPHSRLPDEPAPAAIGELYRSQRHDLLRLAVLMTQDRAAAEDVVQDAFTGLQRRWDTLEDPARAPAYLRVSVVNLARTFHRRRALSWRHVRAWAPESTDAADAPVLLDEEHRAAAAAVTRLPRRQQQVIALRYWAQLPDAEIAQALDIAEVTVRATASRALATLLREMEKR
jgi:RNA polymerase sigma factor (sigma-70 family)